jgi:hypothetical protein
MDEDLIRIVATAAAGLIVRAMGTAAWQAVRDRWSRVLGRGDADEEQTVGGQLDESAHTLATTDPTVRERRVAEVEAEWRGTLRALLRSDPELVETVRELVSANPSVSSVAVESVTQTATVRDGTSIQSGRDTHLGMNTPKPL